MHPYVENKHLPSRGAGLALGWTSVGMDGPRKFGKIGKIGEIGEMGKAALTDVSVTNHIRRSTGCLHTHTPLVADVMSYVASSAF